MLHLRHQVLMYFVFKLAQEDYTQLLNAVSGNRRLKE